MTAPESAAVSLLARALYWGALSKHPAPSAIPEAAAPPEWQAHARKLLEAAGLLEAVDPALATARVPRALVEAAREAERKAYRSHGCHVMDETRCAADRAKLAIADAVIAQVGK